MQTNPKTGQRCNTPGAYRSTCACRAPLEIDLGAYFPRCQLCLKPTGWLLIEPGTPHVPPFTRK